MLMSLCNNRGFTLVEVMVSLVISLVAMFGLLTAVEVATEQNLKNQMRDEALLVAEGELNHWRAVPFGQISTCLTSPSNPYCSSTPARYQYPAQSVLSKLRGTGTPYTVIRSAIVSTDGSAVDLGVRVRWSFKNMSTSHEVHTVRGS